MPLHHSRRPESESGTGTTLEMAHVLFTDIVAYSTLPMEQQQRLIDLLQRTVCSTKTFLRAQGKDRLVCLPSGDGMALVFFGNPEYPVRCALELGHRLRGHPEIKLRMGIHTGPVYRRADINAARNVSGGGINTAQRVMDYGDAGHILVSKVVADMLAQVSTWSKVVLQDLGEVEVKHGVLVHIYNLYSDNAGNPELPQKLQSARQAVAAERFKAKRRKMKRAVTAAIVVAAIAGAASLSWRWWWRSKPGPKDTIVLADFANRTGDAVFDDTLKTALGVALNQSPFLNVLSDAKVAETLNQMNLPANTALTADVAPVLCLRASCKAYVTGSIASLGSEYVLELKAVNCQSGDVLAQQMVTARAKEKVLDALGEAASKLRAQLGEPRATVQKFDVRLEQATTSSLDALKAYTRGRKVYNEQGALAALIYDQNAIELDPNFAAAYQAVGDDYSSLHETGRAREYYTKAFALREHLGEREKLIITGDYYLQVTGELDKAAQTFQEYVESYPRDFRGYDNLGRVYAQQGQYDKALDAFTEASRNPDKVGPSYNVANSLVALQRLDQAGQILQESHGQNLNKYTPRILLYALAFLAADSSAMAEQQQWFAGKPEFRNFAFQLDSDTEAYAGHLGKARAQTTQAVASAVQADSPETAAQWQENAALREAAFGDPTEARQRAGAGLQLAPASQGVAVEAALAFALAGDSTRAESLVQDLNSQFPLDTQMQSLWLPAIRAQMALNRNNPAEALEDLQAAAPPLEFGNMQFTIAISCLYPTYIRGQAYLAAGQGNAAAAEFQKILNHSGIVWNCWPGAVARLGMARAYALQARGSDDADTNAARAKARASYEDFLDLWRAADPQVPILQQAIAEYSHLQ